MRNKTIEEWLIQHEDLENFPYRCSTGKLTIGVGRNLEDTGISDEESLYLLRNDIKRCKSELVKYSWYVRQPEQVKIALINMCFNLGIQRLLKFKKTIKALEEKNYPLAAKHALNSKWAKQVGQRAIDVTELIRNAK